MAYSPEGDRFEPDVVHRPRMLQGPLPILETPLPFPQHHRGGDKAPERAARPPDVPTELEEVKRAFTGRHSFVDLAGLQPDIREAAFRERLNIIEARCLGDCYRLATMRERHRRRRAYKAV